MANPKITYTPAGGMQQTLNFINPPRQQPGYLKTAVRHDNVSTAGVRESVLERVDAFFELNMEQIIAGTDLGNWTQFLDYALTGGPFAYYPDSSASGFVNYLLEDTNAKIEYKAPGVYALSMKLRVLVV